MTRLTYREAVVDLGSGVEQQRQRPAWLPAVVTALAGVLLVAGGLLLVQGGGADAGCSSDTAHLVPSLEQATVAIGAPAGAVPGFASGGCDREGDYASASQWYSYDGDLAELRAWYTTEAAARGWTVLGASCATSDIAGATAHLTILLPSEIGVVGQQGDFAVVVAASATSDVPVALSCSA